MKIIFLNTWAARLQKPLLEFLENHKDDVDVFCFQEVFNKHTGKTSDYINTDEGDTDTADTFKKILTGHNMYYCPIDAIGTYGLAMFLKKDIEVVEHNSIFLYSNPNYNCEDLTSDHNRKMQWVKLKNTKHEEFLVVHVHGFWSNLGKEDTSERIVQSEIIKDFLVQYKNEAVILGGDFNLNPDTKSINILDQHMINLIRENNILTTRTSVHTGRSKFADYVFVSPSVAVQDFKVLPDVVSDHAILFVDVCSNKK